MSKESDYWTDVSDVEDFDLFTVPPYPYTTNTTHQAVCEIHSRKQGLLATIVADDVKGLGMDVTSLFDHLTEPRDVDEYSIVKLDNSTVWEVLRSFEPSYVAALGHPTDQAGAERLLAYLKSNAEA